MSQYEILEILGRGGMGVVYKAKDTILNRIVAIKVFHENLVQQEVVIKRFLRESAISAQLDHANIVKVYSFERQAGKSFLVMEYIQGKPLLDYMEEKQTSLEGKLEILMKVARALHYAHRKNIIHRDIKPSNIMVRSNGEPVVMDFGIAKWIGMDELTRTGEFVGTIQYISLEQAEGKRRELDHRTDIYSLGAVMYHLLVGKPPVEATTFNEMLYQLAYQSPIPPCKIRPEIPPAVEQICLKALAKDKTQRYMNAKEFADDIQNYLAGKKTKAVSWTKKQFWKRWLLRSVLVLGVVFALLVVAFGSYWYSQQTQTAQQQTALIQKAQALHTHIETQKVWRIDQLESWKQAYQHGKEAYNLYQQNRGRSNTLEFETKFLHDFALCAYRLGIHQWVEAPLQSVTSFSSVLDISLPKEQQSLTMQRVFLATDIHLKYLSRKYKEVCENFVSFPTCFQDARDILDEYPEVIFLVAKSHYYCQEYEDTQKYMRKLMQHQNFISHPKIKAEVLYYQGMCYYYKQQYKDALENFENADHVCKVYQKPVDFGISLLIHWGDCQSQLLPYSQTLTSQQQNQLKEILQRIGEEEVSKQFSQSRELALYYELQARSLLWQVDGKDPISEKIEQALGLVAKSNRILPCRHSQHLLRGIAFRYQGKTNFSQYHKAWQEFNNAAQLNPHQTDSTIFIIELTSEYLNFSRDQVFDLIMQLQRWNSHIDSVATDFYGDRMHQLDLQCQGQLQKLVGIPYQERLVEKFYNDLQSPISAIRLLARSSLVDLVSYQNGMTDHHKTYTYLEQQSQQLANDHPLRTTISAILEEIDARATKEATWQYLYLLVRIPYRGRIPDILLEECRQRPKFITFLMQILQDHHLNMFPELQSSWTWIQYLAARVLVQFPYPLTEETLSRLPEIVKSQNVYARKILYDMITSPSQSKILSPLFCFSVAKALQDAQFIWWDRSFIYDWVAQIWPQLKNDHTMEDMWRQTHIVSLLASKTDKKARDLLVTIYQQTRYEIVKAFIVHEMQKEEKDFLPELVVADWYHGLSQQETPHGTLEVHQLRTLHIINAKAICSYITGKINLQNHHSNEEKEQEKTEEECRMMMALSDVLQKNQEDNMLKKAVVSTILVSWDLNRILPLVKDKKIFFADALLDMLKSSDQETRLLALLAVPLIGDELCWQELTNQALDTQQTFIEKIAIFYGLSNGITKNKDAQRYEQKTQTIFKSFLQMKDQRTLGWILAILSHFRYYLEDKIQEPENRIMIVTHIPFQIMQHLSSSSSDLLFWSLISITRLDEYHQSIYKKIGKMVNEGQFPSPMLEILGLGIVINISIKHDLAYDYQKWTKLGYEKLKNPHLRPYLAILVWSYLQAMRNNEINFQLHAEVLEHESEIAIQDFHWLRYQKNLLDPKFRRYAEVSLRGILQLFAQFSNDLSPLEQDQLQQVELMLAELYYSSGNIAQGNPILENKDKYLNQLPIAMLWAEHNPERVHEIIPAWRKKMQQNTKANPTATIYDAALMLRMAAIQHIQEKNINMAAQDLQEAALFEPGEAKSWILLADAMMLDNQHDNPQKVILEALHGGFYQARTHWAWIRYCAKYHPPEDKYEAISNALHKAAYPWEYPITPQMLKDLHCENIPSGEICYRLAWNHAEGRWHYEACLWLKEAAQRNYQLSEEQRKNDFDLFKRYKAKKYQVYEAQATIRQLFESK